MMSAKPPSVRLQGYVGTLDAVVSDLTSLHDDLPAWLRQSSLIAVEEVRAARRRLRNLAAVARGEERDG